MDMHVVIFLLNAYKQQLARAGKDADMNEKVAHCFPGLCSIPFTNHNKEW